jgi:hypothetical protein
VDKNILTSGGRLNRTSEIEIRDSGLNGRHLNRLHPKHPAHGEPKDPAIDVISASLLINPIGWKPIPRCPSFLNRAFHSPCSVTLQKAFGPRAGTIAAINQTDSMKPAVLCVFLCLALSSPALAILRPRYPVKPLPPYHGHIIIIDDNSPAFPPHQASK